MPQNDLGTARGQIKVEFDNRGSAAALAALTKVHQQLETMNRSLAGMEKSFRSTQNSMDRISRNMDRMVQSTSRASGEFDKASRSAHNYSRSMHDIYSDTMRVINVTRRVIEISRPIRQAATFAKVFSRSMKEADQTAVGFGRALKALDTAGLSAARMMVKSGVGSTNLARGFATAASNGNALARTIQKISASNLGLALSSLDARAVKIASSFTAMNRALRASGLIGGSLGRSAFIKLAGINDGMKMLPTWTRNLRTFGRVMGQVGIAAGIFSRLMRTDKFSGFITNMLAAGPLRALLARFGILRKGAEDAARSLEKFTGRLRSGSSTFGSIARQFSFGVTTFIGSFAMFRSGIAGIMKHFEWLRRIPLPILRGLGVALSVGLPVALNVLAKSLTSVSNLWAGLVSGAKQLSGALLVLPGVVATVVAAFSSLGVVFSGLKDQFKDILSDDPVKAFEAYVKLPPHLRNLAIAFKQVHSQFVTMRTELQKLAFAGLENQIKDIGNLYIPILTSGMKQTVLAFRDAKDAVVDYLKEAQTQKDISNLYANTAEIIRNLARSMRPALDGLRDIGSVGVDFIRNMSAGWGTLSQRFAEWARLNRENGRLLGWMEQSKAGLKDLIRGTGDLAKGLNTVLKMFQTTPQTNTLQGFANAMERFNVAMKKSALVGNVRKIGDAVKNMLDPQAFQKIKGPVHDFVEMMKSIWAVVKSTADSFTTLFLPALRVVAKFIETVASIKHGLGLDYIVGTIFGLASAFKALKIVLNGPLAGLRAIGGALGMIFSQASLVRSFDRVVLSMASSLEKGGKMGGLFGRSILNLASAGSGLVSAFSAMLGPIALAATLLTAMFTIMKQGGDEAKAFQDQVDKSSLSMVEFSKNLQKAFVDDNSLVGNNVLSTLDSGLQTTMSNMDELAKKAPSWSRHVGDYFNHLAEQPIHWKSWTGAWGDEEQTNKDQDIAANAQRQSDAIKELVKNNTDLNAVISGSSGAWEDFKKNNADAAAGLQDLRDRFVQAEKNAQALGPAGAMAAKGIDQIAKSAGDAGDKLEGMRKVLQALGFIQVDAMEAAAQYADAIDNLGKKISDAIESGDGLNNVLDKNGMLNVENSQTARNLLPIFKDLGESFRQQAAAGGNVDEMWNRLDTQLQTVASQMGVTKDQLIDLVQHGFGIVPKEVRILVQLDKLNETDKAMGQMMLQLQAVADGGVFVPIQIGDAQGTQAKSLEKQMEGMFGDIFDVTGNTIALKAGVQISPDDIAKVNKFFADHNIATSGAPDVPPAKVPVQPVPQQPGAPGQPAAPGQAPVFGPPMPTAPATVSGVAAPPQPVGAGPGPGSMIPTNVVEQVQSALKSLVEKMVQTLTVGSADQSPGYIAGSKFVESLAAGIRDGGGVAVEEARNLAEKIKSQFHQSPPKEGPLSAHGDAAKYAGSQFVKSYTAGIRGEAPRAVDAMRDLGSTAAGGLPGGALGTAAGMYQMGNAMTRLFQSLDFTQSIQDMMTQAWGNMVNLMKFISDPQGKGTFFGMSAGQAFGFTRGGKSDLDIAKEQAQQQQEKLSQGFANAQAPQASRSNLNVGKIPSTGATPDQVAMKIIAEGQARGYSPEQIQSFLALAQIESSMGQHVVNDNQGPGQPRALGVFQQNENESYAKGKNLLDPNESIPTFYDRISDRGLVPGANMTPAQIADFLTNKVQIPLDPSAMSAGIQTRMSGSAATLYNRLAQNPFVSDLPGGATSNILPGGKIPMPAGGGSIDYTPQVMAQAGAKPFYDPTKGPGEALDNGSLAWLQNLAGKYQLTIQRQAGRSGDALHGGGYAFDLSGSMADKQRFAEAMMNDPGMRQYVAQLIFSNGSQNFGIAGGEIVGRPGTSAPNYYSQNWAGHQDHVHIAFAAPVGTLPAGAGTGTAVTTGPVPQQYKIDPSTGTAIPIGGTAQLTPDIPGQNGQPGVAGDAVKIMDTPDGRGFQITDAQGNPITGIVNKSDVTGPMGIQDPRNGSLLGVLQPPLSNGGDPYILGMGEVDPQTMLPLTDQQRSMRDAGGAPLITDFGGLSKDQLTGMMRPGSGFYAGSTEQQLRDYNLQNPGVFGAQSALAAGALTPAQASQHLMTLENAAVGLEKEGTPASLQLAQQLRGQQSDYMSKNNVTTGANPIDSMNYAVNGAAQATAQIFAAIQSGIESIGSAKDIGDTLVRGMSSTKDVDRVIDDVQKFIELGSHIAGAVAGVTGAIGSVVGPAASAAGPFGGEAGAAIQGVSAIASGIQSALETVNAVIDLAQQGAKIFGSYFGDFLGYLTGGPGGPLAGNVKFLLDEQTRQLVTWSGDNPSDKRFHDFAFENGNADLRNQVAGTINVFGGPGQDPRDSTRQMMFQVRQAQASQAING